MFKKVLFFTFWFLVILIGPYTIFLNTPLSLLKGNTQAQFNFLQRITGLIAFSMLFVQILLGAYMQKWTEKLGVWVFKFHLLEGSFVYSLILLHPLLLVFLNYKIYRTVDPFYVFSDVCALCKNSTEVFYTFGRVAFWLITVAIVAAKFRTSPFLRRNWRSLHVLNYLAFALIAVHSYFVGSDIKSQPFYSFYLFAVASSLVILIYRFLVPLLKKPH